MLQAVLAQAVHNRPSGGSQRLAHLLIGGLHLGRLEHAPGAASVVFEIIDTPGGVRAKPLSGIGRSVGRLTLGRERGATGGSEEMRLSVTSRPGRPPNPGIVS